MKSAVAAVPTVVLGPDAESPCGAVLGPGDDEHPVTMVSMPIASAAKEREHRGDLMLPPLQRDPIEQLRPVEPSRYSQPRSGKWLVDRLRMVAPGLVLHALVSDITNMGSLEPRGPEMRWIDEPASSFPDLDPSQLLLAARIGVSAGDVTFEGGDCFGSPVIEAARLCGAADGNIDAHHVG